MSLEFIENEHLAHNYAPLPIIAKSARGSWIKDINGDKYLDCLSAYSALNFGHGNRRLQFAMARQLFKGLTLTSRAISNDQIGPFSEALSELTGKDMILPMNSGAEGVETALKTARKWGTKVKGIPENESNIIVMENNFHGRTISIVSFSSDHDARRDFGPYTPGFTMVPYDNAEALEEAIKENPNTAAVLLEPIQGEAGIIVPSDGYLRDVRRICTENNVLMMADEIQSGLGRTGDTFACDHDGVIPDVYILGKALGGGMVPLSAVAANSDILGVFQAGEHGSTFGGNPLAMAVGHQVIKMLQTGRYQMKAREGGELMHQRLGEFIGLGVTAVRGRGLWAGVDIDPALGTGKEMSKRMVKKGIIVKDTHKQTFRFAPPLGTKRRHINYSMDMLGEVLEEAA